MNAGSRCFNTLLTSPHPHLSRHVLKRARPNQLENSAKAFRLQPAPPKKPTQPSKPRSTLAEPSLSPADARQFLNPLSNSTHPSSQSVGHSLAHSLSLASSCSVRFSIKGASDPIYNFDIRRLRHRHSSNTSAIHCAGLAHPIPSHRIAFLWWSAVIERPTSRTVSVPDGAAESKQSTSIN